MTIQNSQQYVNGLWDWSVLRSALGGTIEPTDIDGFVERCGQFLVIETKQPGAPIPKGQLITLQTLVQIPQFTVMVVWGRPGLPRTIRVMTKRGEVNYRHANLALLEELVGRWFRKANALSRRGAA